MLGIQIKSEMQWVATLKERDRQNLPVGQYGKCLDRMLKEEAMGGRGEALSPDLVGVGERKRTWPGNQRDWYLAFALLAQRT